jgi:GDPmannose 4,6-dehydratase
LHYSNSSDFGSFYRILSEVRPTIVINLAAQSHVGVSFSVPAETFEVNANSVLAQLEAIKNIDKSIIYYQAGTSEMFGGLLGRNALNEDSKFYPKSPYAVSKVAGYYFTKLYRETYDINGINGILFNHESPRRGENFVSRKISLAAAKIYLKKQDVLRLGNIKVARDWGHAKDYVEAIRLIVESGMPADDWVVASGQMKTVEEFVDIAFGFLDLDYKKYLKIDETLFRPNDVLELKGDSSKLRTVLNWEPRVSFEDLVREMVLNDLKKLGGNI